MVSPGKRSAKTNRSVRRSPREVGSEEMIYLADDLEGRLADHDPDFPALERSRRLSLLETLDGTEAEAAWLVMRGES